MKFPNINTKVYFKIQTKLMKETAKKLNEIFNL